MEEIVRKLTELDKTIATMESCTGGMLVSEITNVEGASKVLKYSAVTYSNEFKIKMGVSKSIIDKYSVYSFEVAKDMSKKISDFASSDYGVGITGKLNRPDENNLFGKDNEVFISIYDKEKDLFYTDSILATKNSRKENKELVVNLFIELFKKKVF